MFGFFGMLLGVPVFAMIYYIIGKLVDYSVSRKGLPTDTRQYVDISGVDTGTGKFSYYKEEEEENA
jgi:hypothetical protein